MSNLKEKMQSAGIYQVKLGEKTAMSREEAQKKLGFTTDSDKKKKIEETVSKITG